MTSSCDLRPTCRSVRPTRFLTHLQRMDDSASQRGSPEINGAAGKQGIGRRPAPMKAHLISI
ncbi:hypothetical protein EMIT0158MI4_100043 [Burkholderia ambifaria]